MYTVISEVKTWSEVLEDLIELGPSITDNYDPHWAAYLGVIIGVTMAQAGA